MAYLNVEEIEAAIKAFSASYPSIAKLISLPNRTADGRQSHALQIGSADPGKTHALIITGGMHAREWVPPDALVNLAADLLEAHSRGSGLRYGEQRFSTNDIRTVIEEIEVILFPCVNPDGRHHSQTAEPMWRKNRRRVRTDLDPSCVGVDINRNFHVLWDFRRHFASDSGVSASDDPCHPQLYVGPAAESEPETRNVVWLLDHYSRARWYIDVHSYVPAVYHSWGFDQNQTSDPSMSFLNAAFDGQRGRADESYREFIPPADSEALQELATATKEAIRKVGGTVYDSEQSFSLYPTSGTSDDFAYSRHFVDSARSSVLSFTIECGHSFQPSWQEAENVIREVCAGIIAFCLAAQKQEIGAVRLGA
jgi:murein tripeptide amidase MpaA